MDLIVNHRKAIWGNSIFDCSIGRSGIVTNKLEGDGGTPVGRFPFRQVFYRQDRIPSIRTQLPITPIHKTDGWCDAPNDPLYNKHIKLPYPASHEELWREDNIYDLILVVGHNDSPPTPGKGSAVFIHLSRPEGTPTEGCVAFSLDNLLSILEECSTNSFLIVKSEL